MCEQISDVPEKKSLLEKIGVKKPKELPFSAEKCWCETKYGAGLYKLPAERIKDKQNSIKAIIESKFAPAPNYSCVNRSSYHCVIDIEEDLINYVDEVLKPFYDGGFEIVNLSEECKSIKSDGIYLISWENTFKKKP